MYKKVVFENYANFRGRARRSEYWYFTLSNFCALILLFVAGGVIGAICAEPADGTVWGLIIYFFYQVLIFIPSLAVTVRRLHDIEKSGAALLLGLIPVGGIILLVFTVTEGTRGKNRYGDDPKNLLEDLEEIGKDLN